MTDKVLPPGLMLVHGNQPEALRDLLVTWMRRYPLAPLEPEIILAQSNGIAQWLKLAIAADPGSWADKSDGGGLGIAAALEISLPSRFLWRVYRAVLGPAAVPEYSPLDKPRLVWRLMRLLPELVTAPVYAPLRRFLTADADLRKRFQLAERLADLFDQYQVYRADWLEAWAAAADVLIDPHGNRQPLPEGQGWQAQLWRDLRTDIGIQTGPHGTTPHLGRAAVHAAFLRRAAEWPADTPPAGLPRRLLVFGISSLPRQSLEVLAAMARWTQVLMFVHNPCEYYWADIVADRDLLRAGPGRHPRRADMPGQRTEEPLLCDAHPLLASWGKQGRDFIGLLDEYDIKAARALYTGYFTAIGQRIDLFPAPADPGDVPTLLSQLQDDIRALRTLEETRKLWPPVDPLRDTSVRFHVAHSPQREVEILHDQLLAAFNADPTLTPRDIMVMVPDIDAYAPHIQAVFAQLDKDDPRYIPFSIADQRQRATDPLVQALATLLALPQSRLAASDLLDLLEVPALRPRFGIAEPDLPRLHRWVQGANIRWGLHPRQRASFDLPDLGEEDTRHTWHGGLRRLLLGYAVGAAGGAWQGIEPYDEIGGLDAALLGPLVRLVDQLDATWGTLREPTTAAGWCQRLRGLLKDYLDPTDGAETYTLLQLDSALQDWEDVCAAAGLTEALPLAVVGEHWLSRLDESRLSQRFFAGAITFATLMPMRAIPFRHVCLLGMNDGDYPRQRPPADFDLMGQNYRPGDRSRREDDRYLFLEALLSARDRLHVSWVGRSITDNSERPPSVLVGQLRDHLAAGWQLADGAGQGGSARESFLQALTQEHHLQPFSPAYFPAGTAALPWFTYAREWRQVAGANARLATPADPLPPLAREEPLKLRDLANFLKAPVKAFFTQRLGVNFDQEDPASEDQEPFALDRLRRWQLNDELIRAQARAIAEDADIGPVRTDRLARIQRRGDLAPGAFGDLQAQDLEAPMDDLFARYQAALQHWPQPLAGEEPLQFQVLVADHYLQVADWLGGIRVDAAGGRGRVVLEASDLVKDKHYRGEKLIGHWVTHLGAHLAGGPLTTRILSKVGDVELAPLDPDQARNLLGDLLAAWHEGMCRPLPLAAETAFAWLKAGDARAACRIYEGEERKMGEVEKDPYLARVFPDYAALTADGEFARWAERLLRPLFVVIPVKGGRNGRTAATPAEEVEP